MYVNVYMELNCATQADTDADLFCVRKIIFVWKESTTSSQHFQRRFDLLATKRY